MPVPAFEYDFKEMGHQGSHKDRGDHQVDVGGDLQEKSVFSVDDLDEGKCNSSANGSCKNEDDQLEKVEIPCDSEDFVEWP